MISHPPSNLQHLPCVAGAHHQHTNPYFTQLFLMPPLKIYISDPDWVLYIIPPSKSSGMKNTFRKKQTVSAVLFFTFPLSVVHRAYILAQKLLCGGLCK